MSLRALGYIRQSRASEAAASPEAQRQSVARFCESQGWTLVDTFEDIGRSGFDPKAQRAGLAALLDVAARGGVDRVVVYRLDRLTRRGIVEALELVQRIEATGAALVSVSEPFDTSNELGKGIFALLLSLARAESEKLRERVLSSKSASRERGGWQGGAAPYGFRIVRVDRDGYNQAQLAIDPRTAPIVRAMVADAIDGKSVRAIVRGLNVAAHGGKTNWTHATVTGMLRNPALAGYLPDNAGDVLRGSDGRPVVYGEPLLDADTFRQLQRAVTPRRGRKPQQAALLGGLARCASCGGGMVGDISNDAYWCANHKAHKPCTTPARVPMRDSDDAVLAVAGYALTHPEVNARAHHVIARWWTLREGNGVLDAVTRELDEVNARAARLRDMNLAGDFDSDPAQYRRHHDLLEARRATLAAQLADTGTPHMPYELTRPGGLAALDRATLRELLAALLTVRCHKRPPGVRAWIPDERLTLDLVTGESLAAAWRPYLRRRT